MLNEKKERSMNTRPFRVHAISLAVTDRCNQKCQYCYNYDRNMDGQCAPDVSTSQLLQVIDLLTDRQHLRQIEITGGEPFLRSDLLGILDHIQAKGLRVGIVSNATKVDESISADLARRKLSHVQTTFLATEPAIHDALSGPGSFAARKAGVQHLVAAGVPTIAAFVCTKANFDRTEETFEMMYGWGMREHSFFMRFCPSSFSRRNRDRMAIGQEELLVALAQANRFGANHGIMIHNKIPIPMCLVHGDDYPHIIFSSCGAAKDESDCYVDQRGDVRLCASNAAVLGNIHSATLDDLLQSEAVRTWSTTLATDCTPCDLRMTCRGGCPIAEDDLIRSDTWVKRIGQFKPKLEIGEVDLSALRA